MLTNLQTLLLWDAIRKPLDGVGYEYKRLKKDSLKKKKTFYKQ